MIKPVCRPYGGPEYWEKMCQYGFELRQGNVIRFDEDTVLSKAAVKLDEQFQKLGIGLVVGEYCDLKGVSIDLIIGGIDNDAIEFHLEQLTEYVLECNKTVAQKHGPEVTMMKEVFVNQRYLLSTEETKFSDIGFKVLSLGFKFSLTVSRHDVYDIQEMLATKIAGMYRSPDDVTN